MSDATLDEIMAELEAMGTAQNRRIHRRHGVNGELFGVSYANLGTLRKQIKVDQSLAIELWQTGNHDARILATMIADPDVVDVHLLDSWISDVDNCVESGAVARLAGKTDSAERVMRSWTEADGEWVERAGWMTLAGLALDDRSLPGSYFESYLGVIETRIHDAKNRVRDAMNSALIAIGSRSDELEREALEVAERVGKVDVDHGETGCKTPAATSYIPKSRERVRKKEAKRAKTSAR